MDDHPDEVTVEQRLADAVEQDAVERRELVHHPSELVPAEVLLGLPAPEGQNAGLAERVAPARGLEGERARERRPQGHRPRAPSSPCGDASRAGAAPPLEVLPP